MKYIQIYHSIEAISLAYDFMIFIYYIVFFLVQK